MASAIIHIAVANELNKKLNKNHNELLIGSIAPDIAKLIGETKVKSHFQINVDNSIPQLDKFLKKYNKYLDDTFVLGYYIHLYTDYLWFKYFIPEICDKVSITKLSGEKIKLTDDLCKKFIYSDYTNLNTQVIDEYNLDLKMFYEPIPKFKNIIKEIPMNNINIVVKQMGIIVENSTYNKQYLFDISNIKNFIKFSTEIIESDLKERNIL